jgi:tetratricopeptide (TPR) repeat protein
MTKMFWPQNLAMFYPLKAEGSIQFWQVAACVLLLLGISFFVVRFGRNQKYLPVGWFWFLGTLIPVIGIVQVGSQAYADRYTYIPYIGLFIMFAWLLPQLLSNWPHRKIVLGALMISALVPLGICAHRQVSYWNNSITLFSYAIEVTQNNWLAYNNRGVAYGGLGRYQDAMEDCRQAVKIKPDYAEAYLNLGNAYGSLNRNQDAIDAHKQAIKIKPDYAKAYFNIGCDYDKLNRISEAIDAYRQAIKIRPDYAEAFNNLGKAYGRLGRFAEAIEAFTQAVKIQPDYADAHFVLGFTYLNTGDKSSALEEYKILKTLDAEKAGELFNLINK